MNQDGNFQMSVEPQANSACTCRIYNGGNGGGYFSFENQYQAEFSAIRKITIGIGKPFLQPRALTGWVHKQAAKPQN